MKSKSCGIGRALLLLLLAFSGSLCGAQAARPIKPQSHRRHHHHHHHHHHHQQDHHRDGRKGSVYVVGDKDGWTDDGIDYDRWSLAKDFHVGDMIVFRYDKKIFKVFEVNMEDYRRCNTSNPINIRDGGHDSFTMMERSHRYFIGEKQSCLAGQKVNIRVPTEELTHNEKMTRQSISTWASRSPSSSPWSSSPAIPPSAGSSSWGSPAFFHSSGASSKALPYVGRTLFVAGIALILCLAA